MAANSAQTISSNATIIAAGPNVIQKQDFFVKAGILHPIIVGSIAIIVLFAYLRAGSNRSVAPITVFDWIVNVALGSTLAGIVNGNSLTRGLLALITMLGFQFITSHLSSNYKERLGPLLQGPPLVIAFRGQMLRRVMAKHRISTTDVNGALRAHGVLNVSQVDCMIIEANGAFSVFTRKDVDEAGVSPDVLMAVPAYRKLCEEAEELDKSSSTGITEVKSDLNEEALRNHRSPV